MRATILFLTLVLLTVSGAALADPPVRVRVGEHPGFSRVVFDWTRLVEYRVEAADARATVTFKATAEIDLQALTRNPPKLLGSASVLQDGDHVRVRLAIPAGARVRHFRDGTKIALDVMQPSAQQAKSAAPVKAPPRPSVRKASAAKPESKAKPEPKPEPAPKPEAKQESVQKSVPALPAAAAARGAIDLRPRIEPPPAATAEEARKEMQASLVPIVEAESRGLDITLPWQEPVAAAVFRRAGFLWLIFDRPGPVDLKPLSRVGSAEQISHPRATVLRVGLPSELSASVSRTGASWVVRLRPGMPGGVAPLTPERQIDQSGATRLILQTQPGQRLDLVDPEVGDRLVVVPLLEPTGVVERRDFSQIGLLATAQGIAIEPKSEVVDVRILPNAVQIGTPAGLLLSRAPAEADDRQPLLLRFAQWRQSGSFTEAKQRLLRSLAGASESARPAARLQLAQFYFAYGFNADAKAVLARVKEVDPTADQSASFRALRGAVNLRLGHDVEAAVDLNHALLDGNAEMALWRGALAEQRQDWEAARQHFAAGLDRLADYPPHARGPFRLAMARAWLQVGDAESAQHELKALERDKLDHADSAEALYLSGLVAQRLGNVVEARKAFDQAVAGDDRRIAAYAEYARIDAALDKKQMGPEEATARLERLRFAWRGDDLELQVLRRLATIYFAGSDAHNALEVLRQAQKYFPKAAESAEISKQMTDGFVRMFLDGGIDAMPPMAALGLYYDFRDLTPADARGDEMIGKLADRLIAFDLLDRAGDLLRRQMDARLQGEAKGRAGVRLAVVHLLNRKPEAALDALRDSHLSVLAAPLQSERRQLQARALAELGRVPEALAILSDDTDRDAVRLRAEIAWQAKDWPKAAQSLELVLRDRWRDPKNLDAGERKLILQYAVAAALAGDAARIDQIRSHYKDRLEGTPEADGFLVVTGRVNRDGKELRHLASAIAQVGQLEAFMATYRAKLAEGGLSAIN